MRNIPQQCIAFFASLASFTKHGFNSKSCGKMSVKIDDRFVDKSWLGKQIR
jgi:hypothetical protein